VGDTLGDVLALEDLGDFFGQELVTSLTDVQDLCTFDTPSCRLSMATSLELKKHALT
jgi:hypothetical protein